MPKKRKSKLGYQVKNARHKKKKNAPVPDADHLSDEGKLSTENASHEEGDSHQSCIQLVVDNVLSKDHFNSRTSIASQPDIQNSGSSAMHFVDHCYAETSKVSQPDIQNSDSSAMPFVDHCYGETSKVSQSSAMHVVDHCYAETSKVSQPGIQNNESSAMHFIDHCYGKAVHSKTSKVSQSSAMHVVDHCYSETSKVSQPDIHNSSDEWSFTDDTFQNRSNESNVNETIDETFIDVMEVVEIHDNLSHSTVKEFNPQYESLRASLQRDIRYPYVMNTNAENIQILSFYDSNEKTSVKYRITVDEEFHVCLKVHNAEITQGHEIWDGLPKLYTKAQDVDLLLSKLNCFNVCCGNHDEEFQSITPIGAGISEANLPGIRAYREGDFGASDHIGKCYDSTIRTVKCSLLVKGMRCSPCKGYRQTLQNRKYRQQSYLSKQNDKIDFNASKYQHCYMTREMLIEKIYQQKNEIKSLESEISKLKRQCDKDILQKGIKVNEFQDLEFKDLMSTCHEDVKKAFPDENSYQRLFWEQQAKFAKSGKNGIRWHPMIIRWCLHIRQKSAKAYEAMRDANFITLPSSRTLFDYSHYIPSSMGFQTEVINMLRDEAKKQGAYSESWKKYVGILFDEVRVKEDLVYDRHTGELVGYCDLDSVGNQILELEKHMASDKNRVAKFVLVVMIRGAATGLKFPLAGFATNSITADFLYPIVWKTVSIVEDILDLRVLFVTCDGASANRKFFNLHRVNQDNDVVYYTVNPLDTSRKIYFISDVPHLVKTARNCFSNSNSHKCSRRLWKDGRDISWLHVVRLFEERCELHLYNPCPKLTRSHIDLTAFSCMKVNLAAQVLSETVGNALEDMNEDQFYETINFIRKMDKFFDCLNVRSLYEGRNKRNPNLKPYVATDDDRLAWLHDVFLQYFQDWKASVATVQGASKKQQAEMQLSHQTLDGLRISVSSICECVKYLLDQGAPFVLTHHFNQDPLEQHFGHLRHKAGANNNPTVYEVRNSMNVIRTVGCHAPAPKRGNTQAFGDENVRPLDHTKLPRRKARR